MPRTGLRPPDPSRYEDWADCVAEFVDGDVPGVRLSEPVEPCVDCFRAAMRVAEYGHARASVTGPEIVPCSYFWLVDPDADQRLVGFLSLRHSVDTEFLRARAGHVGYAVRPSSR